MSDTYNFLNGGGNMGELMRAANWSATSLGSPGNWPDSLQSAVSIALNSGFPIGIYWGQDFTLVYNDAWSTIPGNKHPWALGKPGAVVWPEIWEGLREEFESVLHQGASYRRPDARLFMHRYGYTEECYFDYTLSPITAKDGTVGGVFNAAIETTYKVIHDRRNKVLQQLMAKTNTAKNINDGVQEVIDIIANAREDIPFAMLYTCKSEDDKNSTLNAHTGITAQQASEVTWPCDEITRSDKAIYISDLNGYMPGPVHSIWPEAVTEALIVPLSKGAVKGYLVLGVSARKRLDDDYQQFLETVGNHAGAILNNAHAFEIGEAFLIEQALNEELAAANEELAAANEELASANEEMAAINEELQQTEQNLQQLNEELEERVDTRTRELASSEARFRSMVEQATVAMLVFQGSDFTISTANSTMLSLLGKTTAVLGQPLLNALPELAGQPIIDILNKVYNTGQSTSGNEVAVQLHRAGKLETGYFDFTYTPLIENGIVTGVLEVAVEVTQQVMARKRVEHSEHRLRNMIATTPYGMSILRGRDLVIERANQPILAIWNRRKEQVLERRLMDVFPELDGQPFPKLLQSVFDTGKRVDVPEMVVDIALPEGGSKQYYIDFSYDPLFDLDGNVESILVSVSDITELVNNRRLLQERQEELEAMNEEILAGNEELADTNEELTATNEELTETQQILALINEQLAKSENLFRGLFEQAPLGMAVLNGPEHVIDQVNDNMLQIWGRNRRDVMGKPHRVARPELDGQAIFNWLDEVYASGETRINRELKVQLYAGPGKLRDAYVNSVYQPLMDNNGKVAGILIMIDEVTHRVLERQQTEQAQDQLKLAVESADLGTWYVDTTNGELIASARTKELFGFYADEAMSLQDALDRITDDYREEVINAIEMAIGQHQSYDMEYPVMGYHDKVVRWVRATGKLYTSDSGKPGLFSGTLLDITDRKEREQRKDDFISVASHELKTPLTTLNASMQLLTRLYKANPAAPKIPELIQKSNFNLTRLMHLIEDLMNVTRLQQGKLPLHKTRFKLADLIDECCEHVKTNGTHTIIMQGDTGLEVFADQQRISQVVVNFVNNAVKYAPDSKEILLQIKLEDNQAKVSVQDFGPGIPADKQPHLFDRYYRVHESGIQFSGLGLGLYISAEIIERHNGAIGVESELNHGSTFWFTLPLE